jgi:hypothetical protein
MFETVDPFSDLKVDPTVMSKLGQVVFVGEFSRNVRKFDAYVFQSIERCADVEVGDIKRGKVCICGELFICN